MGLKEFFAAILGASNDEKIYLSRITGDQVKSGLPKINYKVLNPVKYFILDPKYKSCTDVNSSIQTV